jgi:hypothetical protein
MASSTAAANFTLVLIKPSHYDIDGYPITWYRSIVPSNTLAALYGIAADSARRKVLGENVAIHIETIDETNRRVRRGRIVADIRARGGKALICMVGVQSNQFNRAVDLSRPFLDAGLPVAIGGFHVSGCLSMLPEVPPEIREAQALGISIFAGEVEEGRFDGVLADAWAGALKPVYNYLNDLPRLDNEPTPLLPAAQLKLNYGNRSSFDLGRGCPFQCSFCTIINVQGRKSRFRTPEDLERIIRENAAQGITQFFITDDNFARNKQWEQFFDVLHRLRTVDKIRLNLVIQVDTQCHKIPNFITKAAKAGVRRVFIGLENINPDNLVAAKKRQNKITDYRVMLQKWRDQGIYSWAGYILGFPNDTKESILRDIEIIKRELPVDVLEMFILTPLPGSEDHRNMVQRGEWMDPDLNKYNVHFRVTHHPRMSDREWEEAYDAAWRSYYSPEHIETVARRHAAIKGRNPKKVVQYLLEFKTIYEVEGLHPLEGGVLRLKYRTDRRPGLRRELPGIFHLKLAAEAAVKSVGYLKAVLQAYRTVRKVSNDPNRLAYTDLAIAPVTTEELDNLAMFTETGGGGAAADKRRNQDKIRQSIAANG